MTEGLLILLFVLLLALLLNIKLWFFPLFFITFVFLSNVAHDNYSFLVGWSRASNDRRQIAVFCHVLILPLVTSIAQPREFLYSKKSCAFERDAQDD